MRALLDTNIVIHREASAGINQDIGTLFKWLDKSGYEKCIHPITVSELQKHRDERARQNLNVKLHSYEVLKTIAPVALPIQKVSDRYDKTENDKNDSMLLNEVFNSRVEILISEDKKIHLKAFELGIDDRVFRIDSFLEKVVAENPDLLDYKVLSVQKMYFGEIDLRDNFFDSFRSDYKEFNKWFNKKADEVAYVTYKDNRILSFLYLKAESEKENYSEIEPVFRPKKRLKIGTFKVVSNGVRLGERFLKIIFDNAILHQVEEIYVTVFNRNPDQNRLIQLLSEWGFKHHGHKSTENGNELVLVRDFSKNASSENPKSTFPHFSVNAPTYLCAIYPEYHTELFPDSILTNESAFNFKESEPHRNALRKVYISRSIFRDLHPGDAIVFYRTGGLHKAVVTTVGIVEAVVKEFADVDDFILKCRKRSVFSDSALQRHWEYQSSSRPFIVNFLYCYSFPKRPNLKKLIELGVIRDINSAPRGFHRISPDSFRKILTASQSNERLIVD